MDEISDVMSLAHKHYSFLLLIRTERASKLRDEVGHTFAWVGFPWEEIPCCTYFLLLYAHIWQHLSLLGPWHIVICPIIQKMFTRTPLRKRSRKAPCSRALPAVCSEALGFPGRARTATTGPRGGRRGKGLGVSSQARLTVTTSPNAGPKWQEGPSFLKKFQRKNI